MNKFRITLTEVKSIVVEIEAKDADAAARAAKKAAGMTHAFDSRIGAVLVADVREDDGVQ